MAETTTIIVTIRKEVADKEEANRVRDAIKDAVANVPDLRISSLINIQSSPETP